MHMKQSCIIIQPVAIATDSRRKVCIQGAILDVCGMYIRDCSPEAAFTHCAWVKVV